MEKKTTKTGARSKTTLSLSSVRVYPTSFKALTRPGNFARLRTRLAYEKGDDGGLSLCTSQKAALFFALMLCVYIGLLRLKDARARV